MDFEEQVGGACVARLPLKSREGYPVGLVGGHFVVAAILIVPNPGRRPFCGALAYNFLVLTQQDGTVAIDSLQLYGGSVVFGHILSDHGTQKRVLKGKKACPKATSF